ncbi:MAG: putative manganese-dependent inorganic diphosphatase [Oscillospiraceae bacterium]|nr:putative manganese-dependent inorganic diphosphatase [Oscillospiraceae bacterium]
MDTIYVTGHRNPDTDSIVSAMAYAALRNALGEGEYRAARIGHLSDETQMVLERFGFTPPQWVKTVRNQVRDLDYDTPPALSSAVAVSRAWSILTSDRSIAAIPVTKEDGTLYGLLSSGDIAAYDMRSIEHPYVERIPVFNLLSVLEGRILNEAGNLMDTVSGEVTIAIPQSCENLLFKSKDSIVVCGDQPDMVRRALEIGVNCVIVCQAELSEELRNYPTDTCIISTPFEAYRAVRLIYQSIPVERICRKENLECFHLDDFVDDVKEGMLQSRYRCYPILDAEDKVVGTLSRYHLIRPRRKRVVLVDHNEAAQSVPGLEQAEILEIIDHHRLADIQTGNPIYFRNEPVGSTTTIIAGMYQERGLMPSEKLAGIMAAAIVSDTVMFKSPTCTRRDRNMAERMARIANVSLDELGQQIFSASWSDDKTAKELLFSDFKEFHIAGYSLGVGQITCVNSDHILKRKDEFIVEMQAAIDRRKYDMVLLMLTDVLLEGTQLLYLGDEEDIRTAFSPDAKHHTVFLPQVMSRKKQIIPALSAMWG